MSGERSSDDGHTSTVEAWSGARSAPSTAVSSGEWFRALASRSRPCAWPPSMPDLQALHPVVRTHLDAISDAIGVMQHSIGSMPDPAHGYCVDDVSRALQVDLLHARELWWPAVADTGWRNLRFLIEAFDARTGRYRDFRS